MVKTNSKIARLGIVNYIMSHYNGDKETFPEIAKDILDTMRSELGRDYYFKDKSEYDMFEYYMSCLPSIIDAEYYYHSAVDILGDILQESEEERNKYSETQAEKLMSLLIYRELKR